MNWEDIEVKVNKPYPEIVGAEEDKSTVAVLKNLLSSRIGELTAVLQYTFQSVVSNKIEREIAEILEEISIVEMIHVEKLMKAISLFGGIPRYEDAVGNMFNSGYVFYSTKLIEMLNANIAGEKRAIEEYKNAILKVKNQSLKNLFERIIEDEELHIAVFKKIKDNVQFLSI